MSKLTYVDFAEDEVTYLQVAYCMGLRYNAMVAQAQRVCECYLKQLIVNSLLTNNDMMFEHNLRALYVFISDNLKYDLTPIHSDILLLSNFYMNTRYPGKDAYMARTEDIDVAYRSICNIQRYLKQFFKG